jgi:hypothetical protein
MPKIVCRLKAEPFHARGSEKYFIAIRSTVFMERTVNGRCKKSILTMRAPPRLIARRNATYRGIFPTPAILSSYAVT